MISSAPLPNSGPKIHNFFELTKELISKSKIGDLSRKETVLLQKVLRNHFTLHASAKDDAKIRALASRMEALISDPVPKLNTFTKIMILAQENLNPFRVNTETFKAHLRGNLKGHILHELSEYKINPSNGIKLLSSPEFLALDALDRAIFLQLFKAENPVTLQLASSHKVNTAISLFGSPERKAEQKTLEAKLNLKNYQKANSYSVNTVKAIKKIQSNATPPPSSLVKEAKKFYNSKSENLEEIHKMVTRLSSYALHKDVYPLYLLLLQRQQNVGIKTKQVSISSTENVRLDEEIKLFRYYDAVLRANK